MGVDRGVWSFSLRRLVWELQTGKFHRRVKRGQAEAELSLQSLLGGMFVKPNPKVPVCGGGASGRGLG